MVEANLSIRRFIAASALVALVAGALTALAPAANAASKTCWVKNTTSGKAYGPATGSVLQNAFTDARPGDTLEVRGRCVGASPFILQRSVTLVGVPKANYPTAILDGSGTGAAVLWVYDPDISVSIRNLIIENGDATPWAYPQSGGGGIFNTSRLLELTNVTVRSNTASFGGGIVNWNSTLILNNSSIIGNTASIGGGIFNAGSVTLNGSSSVSGNIATDGGGGIYNDTSRSLTLNGSSSVTGNTATAIGGGILNLGIVTMSDSSSVTGNAAAAGGGISMQGGVNACVNTGVHQWIGAISPNDPDDPPTVTPTTCT